MSTLHELFEQPSAFAVRQVPVADQQVAGLALPVRQGLGHAAQAGDFGMRAQAQHDLLEQIGDPVIVFENQYPHRSRLFLGCAAHDA